eukprot:gene1425-1574_t
MILILICSENGFIREVLGGALEGLGFFAFEFAPRVHDVAVHVAMHACVDERVRATVEQHDNDGAFVQNEHGIGCVVDVAEQIDDGMGNGKDEEQRNDQNKHLHNLLVLPSSSGRRLALALVEFVRLQCSDADAVQHADHNERYHPAEACPYHQ